MITFKSSIVVEYIYLERVILFNLAWTVVKKCPRQIKVSVITFRLKNIA